MSTRRWVEWAPKWALRLLRRDEDTVELNFTVIHSKNGRKHFHTAAELLGAF
jgi:hypothetical protein